MRLTERQKKFCISVTAFAVLLFAASVILPIFGGRSDGNAETVPSITVFETEETWWEDDVPTVHEDEYAYQNDGPADVELVHLITNDRESFRIVLTDPTALRWETRENELIVLAKEVSGGRINVHREADASSERVGEMLPFSAGYADARVEDETGDWYHIVSGDVNGYARAAFFLSGNEAYKELNAKQIFRFTDEEQSDRLLLSMDPATPVDDYIPEETAPQVSIGAITIKASNGTATTQVPQNFFATIRTQKQPEAEKQPQWTGSSGAGQGGGRPTAPPPGNWSTYESASDERKALVDKALTYVGGRYVWGGNDPATGVDCSGFVKALYGMIGIELPRYSRSQAELNTRVALQDMRAGDLVFYARDGVVYHVAMYIGDGKIVHARSEHYGIVVDYLMGIEYRAVSLLP